LLSAATSVHSKHQPLIRSLTLTNIAGVPKSALATGSGKPYPDGVILQTGYFAALLEEEQEITRLPVHSALFRQRTGRLLLS
jgi:hypothetical protein